MIKRTARAYAASLIERQLAAAHLDRTDDSPAVRAAWESEEPTEKFTALWWAWWSRRPGRSTLVLDTFEHAPPHVAAALAKMTEAEREEVAEEMARLAEELRCPGT